MIKGEMRMARSKRFDPCGRKGHEGESRLLVMK